MFFTVRSLSLQPKKISQKYATNSPQLIETLGCFKLQLGLRYVRTINFIPNELNSVILSFYSIIRRCNYLKFNVLFSKKIYLVYAETFFLFLGGGIIWHQYFCDGKKRKKIANDSSHTPSLFLSILRRKID